MGEAVISVVYVFGFFVAQAVLWAYRPELKKRPFLELYVGLLCSWVGALVFWRLGSVTRRLRRAGVSDIRAYLDAREARRQDGSTS
jgi:hypothetical protein